jgi:chromate transporter
MANRAGPGVSSELRSLASLFLKLGTVAFGGPAVHIAMMRNEVVQRLKWMGEQEFLDLVGASSLIPGPNSTELAIHLGRVRAGWRGLLVAGACFILPATVIVLIFAWAYVRYGSTRRPTPSSTGSRRWSWRLSPTPCGDSCARWSRDRSWPLWGS